MLFMDILNKLNKNNENEEKVISIFDDVGFELPRPDEIDVNKIIEKRKKEAVEKATQQNNTVNLQQYKENRVKYIKIYGQKINEDEIYEEVLWQDEKGEQHIDFQGAVDLIIKYFKPIYVNETLYLYKDGVYNEVKQKYLKTIIQTILPTAFRRTNIVREICEQVILDERVNKDVNQYSNVMNTHDEFLLNCKNGMLDLRTLQLKPHSYEYYSTIQIQANWDENADCPEFKKFLNQMVPDKTVQKVLQEIVGYCLTRMIYSRRRIFILVGESGTGKSTFINATVGALLPKSAKSNIPLQTIQNDKFAAAQLVNKIVNIYADLPSTGLNDTDLLKIIASDDDGVFVQKKGKDGFNANFFCKMIFSTNHLPANLSQDKTDAFYNRIMIINFNNVVKEQKQDKYLTKLLLKEKDGIFKWAVEGLIRLINNNFNFTHCEEIERNIEEYKHANNSLMQFIEEYCEITNNKKDIINAKRFHDEYKKYCEEVLEQKPISAENVRKQLKTRFNVNKDRIVITENGKKPDHGFTLGLNLKMNYCKKIM